MNLLQFFLTFLVLTVISSGAIVGWYLVTRGEYATNPDGSPKKTGMIFKHWSIFFEQYKKTKTVYFEGAGLDERYAFLKKIHPLIADKVYEVTPIWLKEKTPLSDRELTLMEDCLLCKTHRVDDMIRLSIEEPVYDFPEWVQKPLSSCPACLAGPYGTAIWLVFLKLQRDAFEWTDSPLFAQIAFGMIFLLTLASCNSLLSKKLKL
jgi:hypothetical protein